jgi:hypothetical protein
MRGATEQLIDFRVVDFQVLRVSRIRRTLGLWYFGTLGSHYGRRTAEGPRGSQRKYLDVSGAAREYLLCGFPGPRREARKTEGRQRFLIFPETRRIHFASERSPSLSRKTPQFQVPGRRTRGWKKGEK